MFSVRKAWFRNRYHVFIEGHTEGTDQWLATFRWVDDAWRFVREQEARGPY